MAYECVAVPARTQQNINIVSAAGAFSKTTAVVSAAERQ
jgi:hypothetical protein